MRWAHALVISVLSAAPVAACADDGSSSAVPVASVGQHTSRGSAGIDPAFLRRAGAACHRFRVFEDAHPVTVEGMDPEAPTKAQLRALAAFDRRTHSPFAVAEVWTQLVQQLGAPSSGRALWRPIAADLREYAVTRREQHDALSTVDVPAWVRAYDHTAAVLTRLAVDLSAASLPAGNECARLFGS